LTDVNERSTGLDSTEHRPLELVGRGISFFPFGVDERGTIRMTPGDDVEASLRMIIMTAPGERVMRPGFGCEIWDHVFSPVNAATLGQMAHAVRQALARWEPRVEVDSVRVTPQPGPDSVVAIDIEYRITANNDRRNLVFPFYVIPGGSES